MVCCPIAAAEKSRTGHCGIGVSHMDLEREVERCMAEICTGPVGAVGGRNPAEAGTDRTGLEGGHHTLEELCTKRQPGICLSLAITLSVLSLSRYGPSFPRRTGPCIHR